MKVGDLVQVLPAKYGHYIIVGRTTKFEDERAHDESTVYWNLVPLPDTPFDHGGPMDSKYIEVVSESR
jgi:hypothetical protein